MTVDKAKGAASPKDSVATDANDVKSPIDWALFKETFDAAQTVVLTGHI